MNKEIPIFHHGYLLELHYKIIMVNYILILQILDFGVIPLNPVIISYL